MISRSPIVIKKEFDEGFRAVSFNSPATEWVLDDIGVWIHSVVSSGVERSLLVAKISEQFNRLSTLEIESEIDSLCESGLLRSTQTPNDTDYQSGSLADGSIDVLRVFYRDSEIEALKDEYLLWVLWNLADVIYVVDSESDADIVICESNIPELNQSESLFLLWGDAGTPQDHEYADLVFTSKECTSWMHEKWFCLPSGALDGNIPNHQVIQSTQNIGVGIKRTAARLLRILTGEVASYYKEQIDLESIDSELISKPLLTIGMATFDDYDGVYFSITSLQIHHPEVFGSSEIIILDNNPTGNCSELLKSLARQNANIRYEPYVDKNSTAVRDILFKIAKGDWVMCMDCHVMYPSGVMSKLVDYIEHNSSSIDLLQGPLLSDAGIPHATHFEEVWADGMYGKWGWDSRAEDFDGQAFEIPMQGLGMFVSRKAAWPGINSRFKGFGGEEGYLHEKYRIAGGRSLCLPFLQWSHRFGRPSATPYVNRWEDRINNYLVGFDEVGLDIQGVDTHFESLIGKNNYAQAKKASQRLRASPVHELDHAVCINLDHQGHRWAEMVSRFQRVGIADKVKRVSAVSTPECHHIGCTLTHRRIIESAHKYGYESVLVFEDDALLLDGFSLFLTNSLEELSKVDWKIFYLGGAHPREEFQFKDGQKAIKEVTKYRLTCTHGVLYHNSVYDQILNDLPASEEGMADWVNQHYAIDQYLTTLDKRYISVPKLATQPQLLETEEEPYKHYYK